MIFDHQFAAVVILWFGQEQGGGEVGVHVDAAVGQWPHGVVDVVAEVVGVAAVAVEERREDPRLAARH